MGAVLGGIARLLQGSFNLHGRYVGIAVAFLAAGILAVAAYDNGGVQRGQWFGILLTYFNLNINAAGAWHLVEEGQKKMDH